MGKRFSTAALLLVLALPSRVSAELRHVQINVLGMD
jgi:hypothetical protein